MKTCAHFDLKTDPVTKTPYKAYCPNEVKRGAVCLRHRAVTAFPRRRNYGPPRTEDVRDTPRYEGPES